MEAILSPLSPYSGIQINFLKAQQMVLRVLTRLYRSLHSLSPEISINLPFGMLGKRQS